MTGVETLFDDFERVMIRSAVEEGIRYANAKARLCHLVKVEWRTVERHPRLARMMTGEFAQQFYRVAKLSDLPAPWGWRWYREWDRDVYSLTPLWVYWLRQLWQYRWFGVALLMRIGFMQAPEGALYSTASFTPKFWTARHLRERRFVRRVPQWWYRFAWWCEGKELEYRRTTSVWTQ